MSTAIWDKLKVNWSALNLQLGDLVYSDPNQSVYRADYTDAARNERNVLVRLFLEDKSRSDEKVSRFLEATYFDHPHLLRVGDQRDDDAHGADVEDAGDEVILGCRHSHKRGEVRGPRRGHQLADGLHAPAGVLHVEDGELGPCLGRDPADR